MTLCVKGARSAPPLRSHAERGNEPSSPGEGRAGARYLLLLLLLALVLPLSSQRPSREDELAGIRAEIARLSQELKAARSKATGLRDELAEADLNLRLAESRLAEAAAARDLAGRRVEEGEREVAQLTVALDRSREDLERSLSGLYRLGRQGYVRLLFSLEPDRQLLPSIRLLRFLARRDREAIDRYQATRDSLQRERSDLLARREETEDWIRQEHLRRRQLAAVRERKAWLFARAEQESSRLAQRAEELVDKEKRLAAFLEILAAGALEQLAGTPLQEFRGVLDWPVEAQVTVGFGPRLDPRYKTRVPHNGVALATNPGAGIRVVFPGKALFAAPFQGYGNTVVVQHPGRVFSLYAGLSEVRVGKEDMLSLGDQVGLASDKLYFEIRVENRPEDPLKWLR